MKDEVAEYKNQIAEAIAMGDDELMEKYFSGEEFSEAELTAVCALVFAAVRFARYSLVPRSI